MVPRRQTGKWTKCESILVWTWSHFHFICSLSNFLCTHLTKLFFLLSFHQIFSQSRFTHPGNCVPKGSQSLEELNLVSSFHVEGEKMSQDPQSLKTMPHNNSAGLF